MSDPDHDEMILRALLWRHHGCQGLYGDDGEMQCGECLLDFKRDSAASIKKRFQDRSFAKLIKEKLKTP